MNNMTKLVPLVLLASLTACQGGNQPEVTGPAADAAAPAASTQPATEVAPAQVQQSASFDLPPGAIASIRIQPTASSPGRVTFSRLALVDGDAGTEIDLCADRRLQLVRSRKVRASAGGCEIEFGNGAGTGWMVPGQLRNLPASSAPRKLEVQAHGDLTSSFRVYLDVGQGYGSKDMLQADNGAAAPAAGG